MHQDQKPPPLQGRKPPERPYFAWLESMEKVLPISQHVLTTICMERTAEQPIIADTSGLVSLATDTDQNHEPATKAAAKLRKAARPILLPFDVLVETVNVLGKKSGHETARKAASEFLHPESQFLLIETVSYLFTALEKFKDQPSAVSLTDCIVMAVADDVSVQVVKTGITLQLVTADHSRGAGKERYHHGEPRHTRWSNTPRRCAAVASML